MKKLVKLLTVVLCVLLAATALTACSQTPAATDGTDSSADTTTAVGDIPTVGVIQFSTHPSLDNCYTGLIEGLKAAGYEEGKTVTVDYQNAQGLSETAGSIAQNMISKNYDLIVGIATPAAASAFGLAQGADIPVLFCAVSDPVAAQLVQSLDAPGANCTGTSDRLNLEGQLKMIKAFQPDVKKIGVLYTTSEANSVSHLAQLKELAAQYDVEIIDSGIQSAADVAQAAASLVTKVDCITNFTDNNVVDNLQVLLEKANEAGIPVYGSEVEQVKNGCLASESLDYVALGKTTGQMAAKLLGGADAATMPVELVADSQPVYNPDVAAKLNISLPADYANAEAVTADAE